jgi:hypothetical protein
LFLYQCNFVFTRNISFFLVSCFFNKKNNVHKINIHKDFQEKKFISSIKTSFPC